MVIDQPIGLTRISLLLKPQFNSKAIWGPLTTKSANKLHDEPAAEEQKTDQFHTRLVFENVTNPGKFTQALNAAKHTVDLLAGAITAQSNINRANNLKQYSCLG